MLLHGLVASGIYWGAAYDRLGHNHRLVVPDLLGFGRSPRPTSGYGPDDHVRALVTCLDELGVAEPVTIGAHSLGTLIAIRLAATHPDRVSRVVAFGPPVYPDRRSALAHVGATSPMDPCSCSGPPHSLRGCAPDLSPGGAPSGLPPLAPCTHESSPTSAFSSSPRTPVRSFPARWSGISPVSQTVAGWGRGS